MSLFNSLGIGYSGLSVSQVGIGVTGQNIANADTAGYTRQRVIQSAAPAIGAQPGMQSTGVKVSDIERVFDQLTFDRYVDTSTTKAYSNYSKDKLETLSTFFPEIDNIGIKSNLQEYNDLWQALADSPDSDPVKVALAQQTQTLSLDITSTRAQVRDLQVKVNDEIPLIVDEINNYAKEISQLNKAIGEVESDGVDHANDLRDRRGYLELQLAELTGATVLEGQLYNGSGFKGEEQYNSSLNENNQASYTIQISGFNIVDGSTYHPVEITSGANQLDFHELYYELQNGNEIPMEDEIIGGKLGAVLDIRGRRPDIETGIPSDGELQNVINELDTFSKGMIEATNNVYASSATNLMQSNMLTLEDDTPLVLGDYNVDKGSFSLVVYDIDGKEVTSRDININETTSLSVSTDLFVNSDGTTVGNSIKEQIAAIIDDNGDNDTTNDINSYLTSTYSSGEFAISMDSVKESQGYTFALVDNSPTGINTGTNFAGALGMSRYFDGNSAKDMDLNSQLKDDPTKIQAYSVDVDGNNDVALQMVQMQFEDVNFEAIGYGDRVSTTVYDYFDKITTGVGSRTNAAIVTDDTVTAHYMAAQKEYESVSGVSIDEELTNLIKYQTAYGAAAKVITTVDQMMTTLLGIKN